MLCDVSKIHTGYGLMPRITHSTDDAGWGQAGSTKKVYAAASATQPGGYASLDKVLERFPVMAAEFLSLCGGVVNARIIAWSGGGDIHVSSARVQSLVLSAQRAICPPGLATLHAASPGKYPTAGHAAGALSIRLIRC
jgi:hypothetical protein